MKKLLLIASVFVLFSCKKEVTTDPQKPEPSVSSVNFYPAPAGGNVSVGFSVKLSIPENNVTKINLVRAPTLIVWTVNNPTTGNYTMYDHIISSYPTAYAGIYYFFVFFKADGTTITTTPFQVY